MSAATLALALILALASVDVLRALQAAARAQDAADAAALAAAQEIAVPSARSAHDLAGEYAARNGASLVTCRCAEDKAEAVVQVERRVDLLFAGRDRAVRAWARAVVEGGG